MPPGAQVVAPEAEATPTTRGAHGIHEHGTERTENGPRSGFYVNWVPCVCKIFRYAKLEHGVGAPQMSKSSHDVSSDSAPKPGELIWCIISGPPFGLLHCRL